MKALLIILLLPCCIFGQDYPGAFWMPAGKNNYKIAKRDISQVRRIVIHATGEDSAQSTISWFCNAKSERSAHYLIDKSGKIYQLVDEKDIAYHALKYNKNTIGVELVGRYNIDKNWASSEMYNSLSGLLKYLTKKYDLNSDKQCIVGHDDISFPRKVDPGKYFSWDKMFSLLKDEKDIKWVCAINGTVILEENVNDKYMLVRHPFTLGLSIFDDIDVKKLEQNELTKEEYLANMQSLMAKIQKVRNSGEEIDPEAMRKEMQSNALLQRIVSGKCNMTLSIPDEGVNIDRETAFAFDFTDFKKFIVGHQDLSIKALADAYTNKKLQAAAVLILSNMYKVEVIDNATIKIVASAVSEYQKSNKTLSNNTIEASGEIRRSKSIMENRNE